MLVSKKYFGYLFSEKIKSSTYTKIYKINQF